jgi:hypothetical protein
MPWAKATAYAFNKKKIAEAIMIQQQQQQSRA